MAYANIIWILDGLIKNFVDPKGPDQCFVCDQGHFVLNPVVRDSPLENSSTCNYLLSLHDVTNSIGTFHFEDLCLLGWVGHRLLSHPSRPNHLVDHIDFLLLLEKILKRDSRDISARGSTMNLCIP